MSKYKALLTLDLEKNVTPMQRAKFYKYLNDENWTKLPKLTTTWECSFKEDITRSSALSVIKKDLAGAAAFAAISSYEAATQLGYGNIEII